MHKATGPFQEQFDLAGLSTDLVKAFNNLPREPLFHAASQLDFLWRF